MPSYNGNLIVKAMMVYLGRKLSPMEVLGCEDMAYAIHAPAVINNIKRYGKFPQTHTFDRVYGPTMNGMLVGAKRMPTTGFIRFGTPTNSKIYNAVIGFLGDDFSQKDLDEIAGLCRNATLDEIHIAIRLSMDRGIRSASYIRSIIIGKRRVKKVQAEYEKNRYKKVLDPSPLRVRNFTGADVEKMHHKLKELENDEAITQAAKKKLRFQ